MEETLKSAYQGYRIKLIVTIEKQGHFKNRNEIVIPTIYTSLQESQEDIMNDIKFRLQNSLYFRSQRVGYDLIRYGKEASINTYLAYRIIPVKPAAANIKINNIL